MANGRGLKANEGIMVQSFDFESMRRIHDLLPRMAWAIKKGRYMKRMKRLGVDGVLGIMWGWVGIESLDSAT
ncbi:hypothetical protein GCM10010911_55770 [Paenibacillus nasutitermitis]|uniref:Uncharacterized protein n=2 Tax=Paenibacillus nasutitermitis TaxID=1652958 RepID=A0A916ZDJ3_9BACL|nr:hypothetical protein GCM10010911_55770 [Paenibacillus nasutitermitis]